jgi:hypothetical protein
LPRRAAQGQRAFGVSPVRRERNRNGRRAYRQLPLDGVLYMTLDEHARGGTDFLSSSADQHAACPGLSRGLGRVGVGHGPDDPSRSDPSAYERSEQMGARAPRANEVQPPRAVSAVVVARRGAGFGDTVANGRLIYLMSYMQV